MIDWLQRILGGASGAPAEAAPDDARRALAALLVEAARADGHYDAAERDRIERVLALRYGLDGREARALREEGEAAQAASVDLHRFAQALRRAVPHEERVGLVEALWEVVYADGEREMHESALIRKLCGLLHVPDRDAGLARQRVLARLKGGDAQTR